MTALPTRRESLGDYELFEEGVYRFRFDSYEEPVPSTFNPDKLTAKLIFVFDDPEDEYHERSLHQIFGWTMHAKGRLYPFLKALNGGADFDEDEEVDLSDLKGKKFMGTIGHVTKNKDGVDRTYANLVAATPVKKQRKAAPPPPVEDDGKDLFDDSEVA